MCYHIINVIALVYCARYHTPRLAPVLHGMDDIVTSHWPPMPAQERDRVAYMIHVLRGGAPAAVATALGHSHNYPPRVLKHLEQHGTFAEVQHHRAPVKFTSDVMAAAQQKLLDRADEPLTTGDLVQLLEHDGMLTPPTDHHNFLVHFKEHLAGQDLTLQVGATDMIFRITEESAAERCSVCDTLLKLAPTDAALEQFIFVDETTFEESPHPKGKRQGICIAHLQSM